MKLLRKISFPFMPIYYLVTSLRNALYDTGVFQSKSYNLPMLCVGNLSVGGTGKTPMVEYLIRLLKDDNKLATLSRGYKRKTKGFVKADEKATAETIGDEPLQFYQKFKDITVAVDADRQHGISELTASGIETIILDDAFQHRKVKAGLTILLTTFDNPYFNDYVLPTGNLREPREGVKRADIIVVTKCPENISDSQKKEIIKKIKPKLNQSVFFSWIRYGDIPLEVKERKTFTLVTGIANPKPLVTYLKNQNLQFEHLLFKDHHEFSSSEIDNLRGKDLIFTTEKDYMRLKDHINNEKLHYLPIEFKIGNSNEFNKKIWEFMKNFKKQ